jgi:hypothetical protein
VTCHRTEDWIIYEATSFITSLLSSFNKRII